MYTHTHTPNRKRIHETEGQGGSHLGGFGGRKGKGNGIIVVSKESFKMELVLTRETRYRRYFYPKECSATELAYFQHQST